MKIRGYRIEPGEVEAALAGCPGVERAAVVVREDRPGQKRLVGYVVGAASAAGTAELRTALARLLPEPLVPSFIVRLESLPLTAHGKLDRRALPVPEGLDASATAAHRSPRTATEEILAALWGEILGRERVGIDDNFFALGGDSILSLQVVARAHRAGIGILPRQMFERQTIAELAAVATVARRREAEQGTIAGPLPLTPIQRRFFALDLAEPHHYNQALLFAVAAPLRRPPLAAAFDLLLRHHDALRSRFARRGDSWHAWIAESEEIDRVLAEVDLSALPEADQVRAIERQAARLQASLDLARGPIVRAALFRCQPGRADRLALVIHHLAVDAVSWRVLLADLEGAYRRLAAGQAAALDPKTASYKAWAEALTVAAAGLSGDSGDSGDSGPWPWDDLLAPATAAPDFPRPPLPAAPLAPLAPVTAELGPEETELLLRELPAALGAGLDAAMLAALALTFAERTGESGLLVDVEAHGRDALADALDVSRTVGWFTAVFPLHVELPELPELSELPEDAERARLAAVTAQLQRAAAAAHEYGMRRYLTATGDRLKVPAPPVSFNYLGVLGRPGAEPSLFTPAAESAGPSQSPRNGSPYRFEVVCFVAGGRLVAQWSYRTGAEEGRETRALADAFVRHLARLVHLHRSAPAAISGIPGIGDFLLPDGEIAAITRAVRASLER